MALGGHRPPSIVGLQSSCLGSGTIHFGPRPIDAYPFSSQSQQMIHSPLIKGRKKTDASQERSKYITLNHVGGKMSEGKEETPPPSPAPGQLPVPVRPSPTTNSTPTRTVSSPGCCHSPGSDEALDLTYGGSPESECSPRRCDKTSKVKGKEAAFAPSVDEKPESSAAAPGRAVGPCPAAQPAAQSFKDVLLRPRTFRPRFPAGHSADQVWLWGLRRTVMAVPVGR